MIPDASGDLATSGLISAWCRGVINPAKSTTPAASRSAVIDVRTLLYEAANVMLTRYKGPLKLKDWAIAIAKRSTMRKARIAFARRLAIIMHAMLRHGTEFEPA
jgi:hypothetical protein